MNNKEMETQSVKVIRRRKSSDVEAGYEKTIEVKNFRRIQKFENKQALSSRSDKLANDPICLYRWEYKTALELFPTDPYMRFVDKYYPYAEGGPLLVDEPVMLHQEERCERKREVLNKLGYRYIVLKMGLTEAEDWMELEKCGLQQQTP